MIMPPISPQLKEIAKLLEKSQPQLVVVVGAGVAMGATGQSHASWQGLLEHGVKYLVQTGQIPCEAGDKRLTKLKAAFENFTLDKALDAAEDIEHILKYLDEAAFGTWLKSAFANFKALPNPNPNQITTLEALRDLQQAGALLLTTNYDSLLKDITHLTPVTWEEHEDFHKVITERKDGSVHLPLCSGASLTTESWPTNIFKNFSKHFG
jgi:hypothetical protein